MNAAHFSDEQIEEITAGRLALTTEERAFLIDEESHMEECSASREECEAMSDADLMNTIYWAWVAYTR